MLAQNMMYLLPPMNVYDRNYNLLKIIPDAVNLANPRLPPIPRHLQKALRRGGLHSRPQVRVRVELLDVRRGTVRPRGTDACSLGGHYPDSFVYRVNLATLAVNQVDQVGAVPKFVAVTPNSKYLLVSNWCTYTESVIDAATGAVVRRPSPWARTPAGIAVDSTSGTAYIAMMGSTRTAAMDLNTFALTWISNVGSAPATTLV